jgi:2-oxoglutarate dehydrogenase E2 component (dihydrolipoamide succinyltransferase)
MIYCGHCFASFEFIREVGFMSIEIKVPMLPESVSDATILTWHKKTGDAVKRDETLVELETDKVVLEVPAPADGVLGEILQQVGAVVKASDVLALVEEGAVVVKSDDKLITEGTQPAVSDSVASPAVRQLMSEHGLDITEVKSSSKDGKITKEDVLTAVSAKNAPKMITSATTAPITVSVAGERIEKRVPMSRLRTRVAERLLEAQHSAAMLTTFNEVNLQAVMSLRKEYQDKFEKRHGVRLGFMSFFAKAVVEALKRFPAVNASIDGTDIVYHGYYDIGVAVSTERGLVVPVLKNTEQMTMADIEKSIGDYATRARAGKLALEEIQGGTFTITNGGVFGSLLATPIINPPQTAILGMHKIQERPVAENGQVVIRPMMYLALSYDHRLIDGKESVQFLVTVKELLEDPSRLLLDV